MKPSGIRLLLLLAILATVAVLAIRKWSAQPVPPLIPLPAKVSASEGAMQFSSNSIIWAVEGAEAGADTLALLLERATGWKLAVRKNATAADFPKDQQATSIRFEMAASDTRLHPEGYRLQVSPDSARILAETHAGWFYGLQTLLQLLPATVYSPAGTIASEDLMVRCVQIEDQPRFQWRGFMLDVARHFFTAQEVERVLDALAVHKLNRFHFHLTDDQGWRLEIKAYPRLTEVGAWRKSIGFRLDPSSSSSYGPDGRYGGYYDQQIIRQLVAYAAARHIIIVPEIEMPGHASAALSAYPELSCFGGPFTADLNAGVFDGIFCAGKEETFSFIENVLSEVVSLFPGPYIHIGGDEVPKDSWRKCPRCQERMRVEGLATEEELQAYFIRRVARILERYDRRLVGWSEIREGGLPASAIVMDWIGGGVESAREGHDVVMSPFGFAYFDHYQSTNRAYEPRSIGGFLPWEKVYAFEPIPRELEPQSHHRILGPQANLWTEYIASLAHVEYMMFPRLCAMAEVAWSPPTKKDHRDFAERLEEHLQRLKAMGIRYRPPGRQHAN